MNFFDCLDKIKTAQDTPMGARLSAELGYCYKLTEEDSDGRALVLETADRLGRLAEEPCALTREHLLAAEERLRPLAGRAKSLKLLFVAHAHIDMNWMWGYQETVSITLETFRTVLRLMEQYPQFIFSQSQASCYEIVEKYDPVLWEGIRRRIREGRWEVTASTWTECDKNMPDAESLARHFLYTNQYLRDVWGIPDGAVRLEFQPDTFGHTRATPDLLRKAGGKYYYHCRGRKPGPHLYRWRGTTGETVLVYQDAYWYNTSTTENVVCADSILPVPDFCRENGVPISMRVYGVGDHGGGPTRREIEAILQLGTFPLGPTVEFGTFQGFFEAVEPFQEIFPVHEGELNFVFSGCYSAQSKIKMANRLAENTLYGAEALSVFSHVFAEGTDYGNRYETAWRNILFNQFHDILPGSCVGDSRDRALGTFQEAMAAASAGSSLAMNELAAAIDTSGLGGADTPESDSEGAGVGFIGEMHNDRSVYPDRYRPAPAERGGGMTRIVHVFNPSSLDRTEVTEFTVWDYPGREALLELAEPGGETPPQCVTETGGTFWTHRYTKLLAQVTVPAFGYVTYIIREKARTAFEKTEEPNPRVQPALENRLENALLCARFDNAMNLVSLLDKRTGRELTTGKAGYFRYAEYNAQGDATNRFYTAASAWVEGAELYARSLNDSERVFVNVRRTGDLPRQSITYAISFGRSRLDVSVSLDRDSDMLVYEVQADWFERSEGEATPALQFAVPLAYEAKDYQYQNQTGLISRPDLPYDAPGRDFVFAPDGRGGGAALLSNVLYGYRCENNAMRVTLLRATQSPDPLPETGNRTFRLGIAASDGNPLCLHRQALRLTSPLPWIANKSHPGVLPLCKQFFSVTGHAVCTGVKTPETGERGVILRLAETSGQAAEMTVRFAQTPAAVSLTDLHERPVDGGCLSGCEFTFLCKPHELATIKAVF